MPPIKTNITSTTLPHGMAKHFARQENLKKLDFRVMFFLLSYIDSYTLKPIDKKNLALELGVEKKDIEKSLNRLEAEGILFRGNNQHVDSGYRFDMD